MKDKKLNKKRLAIGILSTVGVLDSLYMVAYHEGLIDSLICPFLGEGCNIVGRSERARHFGVPNAAVGALGYATMAALALRSDRDKSALPRLRSAMLASLALSAAGTSAYLTWEQKSKVRAWCFWCLLSAGISFLIAPFAVSEARRTMHGGSVDA